MNTHPPEFSIVVPVRNEHESVDELVSRIDQALGAQGGSYEVLFVDDGSTDGTLEKLKALARARDTVRVFAFRKSFGKSPALECGFRNARGRYILTVDGDLQDDPRDLGRMHEVLLASDVDMVSGWRKQRRDSAVKILSSKLFNLVVVRLLFGAAFRDMNSGIKLYKAEVARELQLYGGLHRFIPLIASELGFKVAEVSVSHHGRQYGRSKYRASKIFTQIPDLLTVFFLLRYTRRPLHFFGRVGSALLTMGFACLLYLTFLWSRSVPIGTRPLLIFGVLLILVGAQIVFTGLLADLIVNMQQDRRYKAPLKYTSDAEARTAHHPASDRTPVGGPHPGR